MTSIAEPRPGRFDPSDKVAWARAFARHVYSTGGPMRAAQKHTGCATLGQVGGKLFGEQLFAEQLAWWMNESGQTPEQARYVPRPSDSQLAALEELDAIIEIGEEGSIFEWCLMLSYGGDEKWASCRYRAMDLHHTLAIVPHRYQLIAPRPCAVANKIVKSAWRRIT